MWPPSAMAFTQRCASLTRHTHNVIRAANSGQMSLPWNALLWWMHPSAVGSRRRQHRGRRKESVGALRCVALRCVALRCVAGKVSGRCCAVAMMFGQTNDNSFVCCCCCVWRVASLVTHPLTHSLTHARTHSRTHALTATQPATRQSVTVRVSD